jgi:predicted ArsR family transcriptional regulator
VERHSKRLLDIADTMPSMSLESRGQRRRLIDDPRSVRALAHPLRLRLRSIVGEAGQITAADAARELGISHALASHHLRQLAKYGFVEQAGGADRRERPWRLVHTSYTVAGTDASPLEEVMAEQALEGLADWHERRERWAEGWRENAGLGRSTLYLTEAELAELVGAIDRMLAGWAEQRPLDDVAARPPDARPVDFTLIVVPR